MGPAKAGCDGPGLIHSPDVLRDVRTTRGVKKGIGVRVYPRNIDPVGMAMSDASAVRDCRDKVRTKHDAGASACAGCVRICRI